MSLFVGPRGLDRCHRFGVPRFESSFRQPNLLRTPRSKRTTILLSVTRLIGPPPLTARSAVVRRCPLHCSDVGTGATVALDAELFGAHGHAFQ
jgi:hypothetical protein